MKILTTLTLLLMMSMSGFAQQAPPEFRGGNAVVDSTGNLVVFEFARSATGVTVTGLRHSFYPPETSITVQHPGTTGNTQTVTYANTAVQVVGTGTSAIYAIATTYTISGTTITTTQSLIAIRAGQSLPAALSGFPSFALTSPVEAKVGSSDYIALIAATAGTSTSSTAAARTAQVVHFNGNSFDVTSSGTLP